MIPNVFVSSTVRDLHHLRDSIRDAIIELTYNPVLSEYGDIGYLPMMRAEESCYFSVRDCQVAILIIGKRYGDPTSNGLSVTHKEFLVALDAKIPVFTLVEQEVLSFKRVFDESQSQGTKASFPGMDYPEKTFTLIKEISESPLNNGILPFTDTSEARDIVKRQMAHLFSALLRNRFNPLKYEIKDILSELKTLRHELVKDGNNEGQLFLVAIRYLLDDTVKTFKTFLEAVSGSIDKAVPQIIKSESLEDFIKAFSFKLTMIGEEIEIKTLMDSTDTWSWHIFLIDSPDPTMQEKSEQGVFVITKDQTIKANHAAKSYLDYHMKTLIQGLKEGSPNKIIQPTRYTRG